jgi:hypothetical protein
MAGPVSELTRARNISIELEVMAFESTDEDEKEDGACMAIDIAAPEYHPGRTETRQVMNGEPTSALSGEPSSIINILVSMSLPLI